MGVVGNILEITPSGLVTSTIKRNDKITYFGNANAKTEVIY